jgi:hypothetical protein
VGHDVTLMVPLAEDDDIDRVRRKAEDMALELGLNDVTFSLCVEMEDVSEDEEGADALVHDAVTLLERRRRYGVTGWRVNEDGAGEIVEGGETP